MAQILDWDEWDDDPTSRRPDDDNRPAGRSAVDASRRPDDRPAGRSAALLGAAARRPRLVAHVDADCFFLAVHERADPSLRGQAVAVWQYNDVVCVSHSARALGVTKHMHPRDARPLVEAAGGRLVHAFWRDWPGPRVWYGAYNAASRELFGALRRATAAVAAHARCAPPVVERASIDEGYCDLTTAAAADAAADAADDDAAELALGAFAQRVAAQIRARILAETGLTVSVGVGPTKLHAKLASTRAKPPRGGGVHVALGAAAAALLAGSAAGKIPGLGSRHEQLAQRGWRTAGELRASFGDAAALGAALGLGAEAAALAWQRVCGDDARPVRDEPPASVSVTTWTAHTRLAELAPPRGAVRADADAARAGAVEIGGWRFWAHAGRGKSNESRAGWVLLSLCLDLDERVCEHALSYGSLPSRLCVSLQGPGANPEPGPNYRAGGVRSRSTDFPTRAYRGGVCASDAEGAKLLPIDCAVASAGGGGGAAALDEPAYAARIGALVDAVARVVARWAADEGEKRVAQLSVAASGFKPSPPRSFRPAAPPTAAVATAARAPPASEHGALSASAALGLDDVGDIDPAVLAELPADLQAEIRAAIGMEARARGGGARPPRSPPRVDVKRSRPQPGRSVSPTAALGSASNAAVASAAGVAEKAPRGKQARISSFFAPARSQA